MEAHRFAIEYHRASGERGGSGNPYWDDIPGIGPGQKKGSYASLRDIEAVRALPMEELEQTCK